MSQIYTAPNGDQVYDFNGATVNAKTGAVVAGGYAPPDPFKPLTGPIGYGQVNTNSTPSAGVAPGAQIPSADLAAFQQANPGVQFTQDDLNHYNAAKAPVPVPTLNSAQSTGLLQKHGILNVGGLSADALAGLTEDQANQFISAKKTSLLSQNTANTSTIYNPDVISGARTAATAFDTSLKSSLSNPFDTVDDKTTKKDTAITDATDQFAALFPNPDEFMKTYQTNPDFTNFLNSYLKAGGTISDILSRIKDQASAELPNQQTAIDYLAENVYKPQESAAADAQLDPYRNLSQQEIDGINSIPSAYKEMYLGKDGQSGYIADLKTQTQAGIDKITAQATASQGDTAALFDLQVQKNNLDAQNAILDLEDKRSAAKKYLVGRLASLGALTTTGEAGVAVTNLDAKYDRSVAQVNSNLTLANSQIIAQKNQAVNQILQKRDSDIATVQNNLSDSTEKIQEKLLELQSTAQDKVNSVLDKYQTKADTIYQQHNDKAETLAKDYITAFYKTVSNSTTDEYLKKILPTLSLVNAKKEKAAATTDVKSGGLTITQSDVAVGRGKLDASKGPDGYVDPAVYQNMFETWTGNQGAPADFIKLYPPDAYVNPANNTLPVYLRSNQSLKTTSGREL